MRLIPLFATSLAIGLSSPPLLAQQAMPAQAGPAASAPPRGPAGPVDDVLARISKNAVPPQDIIDPQDEVNINRNMNISKSVGSVLKPVGYAVIGKQRMIYASEDGERVTRLNEGNMIGLMRVTRITEQGVSYSVGGKPFYSPLSYTKSEAPKAPQAPTSNQTISPTQMMR